MNIYWITGITLAAIIIYFYVRNRRAVPMSNDQINLVKELINKELNDIEEQRQDLIDKYANEGKTLPIDTFIEGLDQLLKDNPDDDEIAFEVGLRKQELFTKYKKGVPIEIAYQWQKEGDNL